MQLPWVICLVYVLLMNHGATVLIKGQTNTPRFCGSQRRTIVICIYVYESLCVQSYNIYLSYVLMNTCVCLAIS